MKSELLQNFQHFMVCIDIFLTNLRIFLSWQTFSHFLTFFSEKAQHNFIKTRGEASTAVYKLCKKQIFFPADVPYTYTSRLGLGASRLLSHSSWMLTGKHSSMVDPNQLVWYNFCSSWSVFSSTNRRLWWWTSYKNF